MPSFFRRLIFTLWYFRHAPWDSGISPPELMAFIESHPPGRALDLGCGTGTNGITLARRGWEVTGVDFVPSAIHKAREKAQAAGVVVKFFVGDVTHLEGVDGPFDFFLDLGCFHGLNDDEKQRYLDQVSRLSSPSGFWLVYGFFKRDEKDSGPGLVPGDLKKIQDRFELVSRQDGFDKRERPSAYFLYKTSPKNIQL
jgi:ubiquinone/menaquinone biosynthesis C-methylase UbiE